MLPRSFRDVLDLTLVLLQEDPGLHVLVLHPGELVLEKTDLGPQTICLIGQPLRAFFLLRGSALAGAQRNILQRVLQFGKIETHQKLSLVPYFTKIFWS